MRATRLGIEIVAFVLLIVTFECFAQDETSTGMTESETNLEDTTTQEPATTTVSTTTTTKTSSTNSTGTYVCVANGRFINTLDTTCQSYYYCYKYGGTFIQYLMTCPSISVFDSTISKCIAPASGNTTCATA